MNAELTAEQQARNVLNQLYSKPYPGSHAYTHAADAIAAAITDAQAAARDEQLQRDCAAICEYCAQPDAYAPAVWDDGWYWHDVLDVRNHNEVRCYASGIWRAWTVLAATPPAGNGETK